MPAGLDITHQTGRDDVEWVRDRYREVAVGGRVVEYLEDMPREFAAADLVIARAGASTVAEITGLPAPEEWAGVSLLADAPARPVFAFQCRGTSSDPTLAVKREVAIAIIRVYFPHLLER